MQKEEGAGKRARKGKGKGTNQEFAEASVCRSEQRGVIIAGVPNPLAPIPLLFSLPPNPLPLSTPFTQAKEPIKIRANA